jgi:hypothetical protein
VNPTSEGEGETLLVEQIAGDDIQPAPFLSSHRVWRNENERRKVPQTSHCVL